jgi:putative transposase
MSPQVEPVRARIRRWYVPNAVYFLTTVTQARAALFCDEASIDLLRSTLQSAKRLYPFTMLAYAILPDHLHLLIRVPEATDISRLMQSIKWNFTRNYKRANQISASVHIWQRGYWDHVIRDNRDLERHFDYVHYNPVKHGYVRQPADYAHSSFREYLRPGWYGPAWAEDVDIAQEGMTGE